MNSTPYIVRTAAAATLLLGVFLMPQPASAQLETTLNAQRFEPAPSYHSFMTVDTARQLPAMKFGFDLNLSYAWRPVQIATTGGERQSGIIDGLIGGELRGAFAPTDWAEININFPFMQLTQVASGLDVAGNRPHYGIGDLRLSGRFRLLAEEKGVGIALIPFVSFPTGSRNLFATRGTFTFGGRVAVSRHWRVVHFGVYAGYRFVPGSAVIDTFAVDDEINYGAGIGVSPIPDWLDLNLELMGTGIVGPARSQLPPGTLKNALHSPLELHVNARVMTPVGVDIVVGGGPGLTAAVGTPGFRVYGGVSWAPPISRETAEDPDPDNDGIKGARDKCPNDAEDKDGFEDEDGCPDPDNDKDGIADASDQCPDDPEGEADGFKDDDGCPDPDNDEDGVADGDDKCPLEAEDKDGFEDEDGCPDTDNDKDGITDDKDICPDLPEEVNGFKDEDGCPDAMKTVVKGDKIVILEKVLFKVDKAEIIKDSFPLLEAVKQTLLDNPRIKKVRIEGHTDNTGEDDHNMALSVARAKAVMTFLVKAGIAAERLESKGYGETKPIVANDTDENLQKNRRVEFTILEQELETVTVGVDEGTDGAAPEEGGDKPEEGGDKPEEGGDKPEEGGDKPEEGGDKPE